MEPLIYIIAPAKGENRHNRPLVESLLNQSSNLWKCIIYHNGPNEEMGQWIKSYNDSRLIYKESAADTGQWGCKNRQDAIQNIVDGPYVINTSIQDYYIPCAIKEIQGALSAGADMVHWQAINHLFRYNTINGEIAWGHIDWGQWCVRTEYIRQTGIVHPENFSGDWHTLQGIIQKGLIKKIIKLDRTLTIHN